MNETETLHRAPAHVLAALTVIGVIEKPTAPKHQPITRPIEKIKPKFRDVPRDADGEIAF